MKNQKRSTLDRAQHQQHQQQQQALPLLQAKAPPYQKDIDYFKEYWRLYLRNEALTQEVEAAAKLNCKELKKIFNLEDYYEHHLIPQLMTYPHKFVHRIRQQQIQRQQQQQKLIQQQLRSSQQESAESEESSSEPQIQVAQPLEDKAKDQKAPNEAAKVNPLASGIQVRTNRLKEKAHKRKKHIRRTAAEINRDYICPYAECGKYYGSEGSLNLHIKIKHNGGNKTEREKTAKTIVAAFVAGKLEDELESFDLNLPPGSLQKAIKKAGLQQQATENEILKTIRQHYSNRGNLPPFFLPLGSPSLP